MRSVPFSPEDLDWFSAEVLRHVGTFRYLMACGEKKTVARIFRMSGQRIGQRLADLERALAPWMDGGSLVNPTQKRAIPTEAGRLLLGFADDIAVRSESLVTDLVRLQLTHEIRVATIHSAWTIYGAKIEAALTKRIPGAGVNVTVITGMKYVEKIEAEVREGRADIGICSFAAKPAPPLVLQPLIDQELRLVMSASYPLLPPGKLVSIGQMFSRDSRLKLVMHRRALDGPLSRIVLHYLRSIDADFGPETRIEAPKIADSKETVEQTPRTMAMLPEDTVRAEVRQGRLCAYRLTPVPPKFTWGLIYRPGSSRRVVREFIECFRPLYKP